jgi:hypothetical protein
MLSYAPFAQCPASEFVRHPNPVDHAGIGHAAAPAVCNACHTFSAVAGMSI